MNTAHELLHEVEAAGGRITLAGDKLRLTAPESFAAPLIEKLRSHKPEIMRLLAGDDWTAGDWQVHYDERAAILEHDGEMSRKAAEARAWECCIVDYLNRHPATSEPGRCAWCGKSENADRAIVPFGVGKAHAWLHHHCWTLWQKSRHEQAERALTHLINRGGRS